MGADLYIRSLNDQAMATWKPRFDLAVKERDSYQPTENQKEAHKSHGDGFFNVEYTDGCKLCALQKAVTDAYNGMYNDGYFRDSYNSTSVLWRLGLSWWQDVIPMCEEGELRPEQIRKLRDMIAAKDLTPVTVAELQKHGGKVDDDENSPAKWDEFYRDKRDRLLKFLDAALELNESIVASL